MAEQEQGLLDTLKNLFISVARAAGSETVLLNDELEQKYGQAYTKFRDTIEADETLQKALGTLTGGDGSGSAADTLKTLGDMAAQDPALFDKLNTVLGAEGAKEFLQTAAGNEQISAALSAAIKNPAAEGDQDILGQISTAVKDNPDLFKTINEYIQQNPEAIESIADKFAANPQKAVASLQQEAALAVMDKELAAKHGESYTSFRDNIKADPELQKTLSSILGGGDNSEGTVGVFEKVGDMAERDPALFDKLNTVLGAEGAKEFLQTAAGNEQLKTALSEAINKPPSGEDSPDVLGQLSAAITENPSLFKTANGFLEKNSETLDEFAKSFAKNPQTAIADLQQGVKLAAIDERLAQMEGYEQFRGHLTGEGPLKEALGAIVGDADPLQTAEKLDSLAQADPKVFTKLNNIIAEKGFAEFAHKVSGNENLRAAFGDMLTDTSMSAGNSLKIINSLHEQVNENDDFFVTVNKAMDDHPGMVNTIAKDLANNPDGAFAQIQLYLQGQELLNGLGLQDIFGEDFEFSLEGFAEILLALLKGFHKLMDGMVSALVDGDFTAKQGNGGPDGPTPAAEKPGAEQEAPRPDTTGSPDAERTDPAFQTPPRMV